MMISNIETSNIASWIEIRNVKLDQSQGMPKKVGANEIIKIIIMRIANISIDYGSAKCAHSIKKTSKKRWKN